MTGSRRSTVLVLTTSPRADSASSRAASVAAHRLMAAGFVVWERGLRQLPSVPAGLDVSTYPSQVRALVRAAEAASGVVIAAPVHQSSVAGIARNAVELLRDGIEGKLVLPVIAAGSQRSTLAAHAFRGDLIINFGCDAMQAVLLSPDVAEEQLSGRLETAIVGFISTLRLREETAAARELALTRPAK